MSKVEQLETILAGIKSGNYSNQDVWPTATTHGTVAAAREARAAYNQDTEALKMQLKRDLELAYGLYQHSKADLLWALAWDYGHDAGLQDVFNYYGEMAGLLIFSC